MPPLLYRGKGGFGAVYTPRLRREGENLNSL